MVEIRVHSVDCEYHGKANAVVELLDDEVNYLYELEFDLKQFDKYKKRLRSGHIYIRTINEMKKDGVRFVRLEKSYNSVGDGGKPVTTEEALKRVRKILEGLN
jgi:hypothetical protein